MGVGGWGLGVWGFGLKVAGLFHASIDLFRSIYGSLLTLGAYHFSMGGVEPQMGDDEEYNTQAQKKNSKVLSTVTFL